jgi:hypothetical protein
VIDTLLVTINPSDGQYFGHRHNAIAVADAAGMGVIGMKVFADAAYYHKGVQFSRTPADVYSGVGSEALPSDELIRYSLSIAGVDTVIVGIGHIDADGRRCQLQSNLAAAQITAPLSGEALAAIESRVAAAGKHRANGYFQRKAIGLSAARHIGVEPDTTAPLFRRVAVRVRWDTAYAGAHAIDRYQVLRDDAVVGEVPHAPQFVATPFQFYDVLEGEAATRTHTYKVRTCDVAGGCADSVAFTVDPVVLATSE